MAAGTEPIPVLSRVEAGGVLRGLSPDALERTALSRAWDGIRVVQLRTEPQEVPRGHLLNHVVTLNLGAEASCDTRLDGGAWQSHRTPHHGVGVCPALLPHAARVHHARDYLVVEIAPAFVTAVLEPALAAKELRPVVGAQDPFAKHVLLALAEEARRGDAVAGAIRVESLGTALVAHLLERSFEQRPAHVSALSSPKLRRVLDYVAAHLDAPLTLRRLSELAEMDVFRFVRAFKQSTGVSPHRHVLQARIALAKELLRDRSLSITEVALRTGFATPSHFSVTFRRIANATPRAYRDGLP
jgi:AraC family transcriptional regulator